MKNKFIKLLEEYKGKSISFIFDSNTSYYDCILLGVNGCNNTFYYRFSWEQDKIYIGDADRILTLRINKEDISPASITALKVGLSNEQ